MGYNYKLYIEYCEILKFGRQSLYKIPIACISFSAHATKNQKSPFESLNNFNTHIKFTICAIKNPRAKIKILSRQEIVRTLDRVSQLRADNPIYTIYIHNALMEFMFCK